ncbi:tetratricopeptide repeat protein [Undibacterium sp. TJN25]|uniref:tetratricopeptide repeat protein n=1 Tax=Undibacterium sp. TJN25 TaxID=3413056 RepID=UPI003BEFF54D
MTTKTAFPSLAAILLASAMLAGVAVPAMAADEPTLHQVYQAADAGKLGEAQEMMQKVLHDHPNSAKAHFVEAELSAKQGRFSQAEIELATAERLAPGLPFAKPAAVQELKTLLNKADRAEAQQQRAQSQMNSPAPAIRQGNAYEQGGSGMPWGIIILGVGALALIIFFVRRNSSRPAVYGPGGGNRYGTVNPMQQGYAPNGYPQAYPQQPGMTGGGIGSGIMGGLATGAAVGAGMVAGEALMHHFTDGDRHERASGLSDQYLANNDRPVDLTRNDDMGGTDFGVSDNSSWDDAGGGGGGDDWDN